MRSPARMSCRGAQWTPPTSVFILTERTGGPNNPHPEDYGFHPSRGQEGPSLAGNRPSRERSTMKKLPKVGLQGESTLVVDASNRITFADARMPSVLATPWLVAHLEYTSRDTIAPCLDE